MRKTTSRHRFYRFKSVALQGDGLKRLLKGSLSALTLLSLVTLGLMLTGCGGTSGGISSQVVSGTAAVGAPLSGQVSLKDSSTPPQQKSSNIGSDGSYAIDVTGMKAPYVLQATGSAAGASFTLNSYADGAGTANINPLSDVIVASAAGVDNPSDVFDKADSDQNHKIGSNIAATVSTVLAKLQPLLLQYSADHTNPITARYIANHIGLDDMFDNVKITVTGGTLSIIMSKTGAVVFTGLVSDIASGVFNGGALPPAATAPATPTGLSAVGGSGQMTLSWNSVGNATSYNLYFSTTSGVTTASGTKIASTSSPYVQTGLSAGTGYFYIVTAVNSAGESAASAQASASTAAAPPAPTVPAAPSGLIATGGTNQVTLSWSSVAAATSYNVYWSANSGVTVTNGTKIAGASSPAVQTGLTAGASYYYIVTAVNSVGESAASVQVAATTLAAVPSPTVPAAPAGVTATGGANQATISWPAVSGAASYNVYWSTASGVSTTSGTKLAGASSPYVQTGLSAGTTYYYVVTAVNSVGESAASSAASASTTPPAPSLPAAPTGVSATGAANKVTTSWTAVSGATSYNIYWSSAPGVSTSTGTKITGAASPYAQTGLSAGTSYYYIVTALNAAGEGPASAQVSAATSAPVPVIPAAPAGVSASGGAAQATISWPVVSGATSYNVYYSTASGVTAASGTKITGASSPYLKTGLSAGTSYYFIVTAVNSAGESAASAQATATTNAPAPVLPAAPAGVSATGAAAQVTISWSLVSGATSYNLYYSTASGVTTANGTKVPGASSPYLKTGLSVGTSYYFIVTAVNAAGESAASAQATATTSAPAFDALGYYNTTCLGCHGSLGVRSAAQITSAIASVGDMKSLGLTAAQISAIAAVTY